MGTKKKITHPPAHFLLMCALELLTQLFLANKQPVQNRQGFLIFFENDWVITI